MDFRIKATSDNALEAYLVPCLWIMFLCTGVRQEIIPSAEIYITLPDSTAPVPNHLREIS